MNQVHGTPFYDPKQPIVFWRENLPHWHQTGKITFITFRLNDSMPQVIVRQYREVKEQFIRTHPYPWDAETFRQYDELLSGPMQKYIDAGYGSCVLKDSNVRKFLVDSIGYYDNERYLVWAYVIMPNHVHLLATGAPGFDLGESIKSVMSYSARNINRYLGKKGTLWNTEPFDSIVRSAVQYRHLVEYIRHNPDGLPYGTFEFGGLEFSNPQKA